MAERVDGDSWLVPFTLKSLLCCHLQSLYQAYFPPIVLLQLKTSLVCVTPLLRPVEEVLIIQE